MAVQTNQVFVGGVLLYTGPVGTAVPPEPNATPGLAVGAPWPSPWLHAGATEEGVSLAVGSNTVDHFIDEQGEPVLITVGTSNIRILSSLSEDTLETMRLAYGGGVITTATGKKTLKLSDELEVMTAGLDGVAPGGFARRIVIPRVVSVADVTTPNRRSAANRIYGVELRCLSKRSDIYIFNGTA
jgi:hypothetical protein